MSGESGEIRIAFKSLDQLDDFCRRLCQPGGEAKADGRAWPECEAPSRDWREGTRANGES